MPHARVPLPDVYESVIRKVMIDTAAQLAQILQVPPETEFLFPGRADSVPMNGGEFGNCCTHGVKYDPQERVVITYDEQANEMFTLVTNVMNNQNVPIFEDKLRGIRFTPIRRFVDVRMDIEYQAPGMVVAQRWLDDVRTRIESGGAELTLDAQYSYQVPDRVIELMKHLYETFQSSEFPIDLSYEDWVKQNWNWPTTILETLWGTDPELTIPERQLNIVGWFDFTSSPEALSKSDDNTGTWTSRISYFFRYERPTQLQCVYPMVIHQKPIAQKWRPAGIYYTHRDALRRVSRMKEAFDKMFVLVSNGFIPWIQYPDTDDWNPPEIPSNRFTFFTGLLSLSCPDLEDLLDVQKLGAYKFKCYFLEYFSQVGNAALENGGLFEFRLYKNDEWTRIPLEFKPGTLIVRSTQSLDPQAVYHIQVSINMNWYALSKKNIECLRRYPTLFWTVCNMFNVGIGKRPLAELDLLGVGRPRFESINCPGEGTSDWTKDCPTLDTGIIKIKDMQDAIEDMDNSHNGDNISRDLKGPYNVLFGQIITERR